ncbi:hypothetical protein DEJ48_07480 [Streptomyces venezuelae]|uniref:Uncharacterized protein n=1 Tax=Streptomyces venezuelae TaxID=54571 RepID=A0A5P2BSW6_STRVZ|nr:hypothetical protein DEJ48_07480 [Streptomyces venezuelae]
MVTWATLALGIPALLGLLGLLLSQVRVVLTNLIAVVRAWHELRAVLREGASGTSQEADPPSGPGP